MDGDLDDEVWKNVPISSSFVTNSPEFGKESATRTEVKVVYDNTSLYIGAYIYDDPENIRRQFTARDNEQQADVDYFAVFLDTYKDRQNAFEFLVTTRNVQSDARVSPNAVTTTGLYGDLSWDAVWDSQVRFQKNGWSVEIKIPLYSIRFSKSATQEWGIQFMHFSRRLNEISFWNPVNPNESGFVNQFGDLVDLKDLSPPLRLSFSPYLSTGLRNVPRSGVDSKSEWLRSGGMDVKYGISESFTLDATIIPDFGQVISDNVINNISPFEIQFRENRPFFTEGTELFNKAGIFYSRRIGNTPSLYESIYEQTRGNGTLKDFEIIKNPAITRLYNAVKFSGRTSNNLGIGIFNAIAQPTKAILRSTLNGRDTAIVTEELTNYNVFVLDQALKNRSYITLTNTNVIRDGHGNDANVTGLDVALYDKDNRYGILIRPRYSKVFGEGGGFDGFKNYFEAGKVSGRFQYIFSNTLATPKYYPNDLGFLASGNIVSNRADFSYNIFQSTRRFLNQSYGITAIQSYLYKPFEFQKFEVTAFAKWVFNNFWNLRLEVGTAPVWYNDFFQLQTPMDILATPRQKLRRPPQYYFFASGSTDRRKKLFANWEIGGAESPLSDDPYTSINLGLRYRFNDRLSIEGNFDRRHDNGLFGYAFLRDRLTNAPILARRQYTDVTTVFSGIYNFTSRMNITFRARHFWNKLINTNLFDVTSDGNWIERFDITPQQYHDNYNAFNLDVFYTWDFRLGSRIIFGWKNWLGQDFERSIDINRHGSYIENAGQVLSSPHGNEITLRFIYFLDHVQFRRKK